MILTADNQAYYIWHRKKINYFFFCVYWILLLFYLWRQSQQNCWDPVIFVADCI